MALRDRHPPIELACALGAKRKCMDMRVRPSRSRMVPCSRNTGDLPDVRRHSPTMPLTGKSLEGKRTTATLDPWLIQSQDPHGTTSAAICSACLRYYSGGNHDGRRNRDRNSPVD